MSETSAVCMGIGIIASVFTLGPALMFETVEREPARRSVVLTLILALLTCWIWAPWICYGVYVAGRKVVNSIDYQERPEIVIPADPKTIDLRKVEK